MSTHRNIEKKIHIFLQTVEYLRFKLGCNSLQNAGNLQDLFDIWFMRDVDILRGSVARCYKCEERIEKGRNKEIGAYQSKDSKFYKWFDFIDYPEVYESWWGIDTLPKVKGDCKEFQNYIAGDGGVIEKFMKMGIAGVRLDVVDEYGDDFVKKIAAKVHEFGENKVVMGEVWEDASTKISYSNRRTYFAENELNSVMNYPYKESVLNFIRSSEPYELVSTIRMLQTNYPKVVQDNLMNFLTTHDTVRFRSELETITSGNAEQADKLMKLASGISFTKCTVAPTIFTPFSKAASCTFNP